MSSKDNRHHLWESSALLQLSHAKETAWCGHLHRATAYLFQGEGTTHRPVRSDGLISPWLRLFMLWASFLFGHCDASLLLAALHIFALISAQIAPVIPADTINTPFHT